MTQIKSNQIKSNRYYFIVAVSIIACLIFTACNSRPTQVSNFTTIPEDMTNTGPNTNDTTPSTGEVTYRIGVTYPEVQATLKTQGIDLSKVSTNSTNSAILNQIWTNLANSGGKKLYVQSSLGEYTLDKEGNSRAVLYFDEKGDIYYKYKNTGHSNPVRIKSFVKAVLVKISDADAQKIYQTTGSIDGQYTIGGIYKVEADSGVTNTLKGNGMYYADNGGYELIYLNAGRSKSQTFNGNNYDSAGFSYDVRYGYTGSDITNDNSVYDVEKLSEKFPSHSIGLKDNDKWSYQVKFYRTN